MTTNNSTRSFLAWVWAGVLIAAGAVFLGINTGLIPVGTGGSLTLIAAAGLAVMGIPFLARWLVNREEWWAIITAWVFFAGGIFLLAIFANPIYPQFVVIVGLTEIALPIIVAYLMRRDLWWLLIPIYILSILSVLLALTIFGLSVEVLGAISLICISLPFWRLYATDRVTYWWAMIPGGLIGVVGAALLVMFSLTGVGSRALFIILNVTLAAVSFALWWVVRKLDVALWLSIGFVGAAILSYWFPTGTNWALLAPILGVYIIYRQLRPSTPVKANTPSTQAASTPSAPAQQQPAQVSAPPPPAATSPSSPAKLDAAATAKVQEKRAASSEGQGSGQSPLSGFRQIDPLSDRKIDDS